MKVNKIQGGEVFVDVVVSQKASLERGLVVCVYQDNQVSILVDSNSKYLPYGFVGLGSAVGSKWHTCSSDYGAAIERVMDDPTCELHYFNGLADFAQAVLDNGWMCHYGP